MPTDKEKQRIAEEEQKAKARRAEEERRLREEAPNQQMMAIYIQEQIRKKKEKEMREAEKQGEKIGKAAVEGAISLFELAEGEKEGKKMLKESETDAEKKIYGKKDGNLSVAELVEEVAGMEDGGQAFRKFNEKLKSHPTGEQAEKALAEFVREARAEILSEIRQELERRRELAEKGEPVDQEKAQEFEYKLNVKLNAVKQAAGRSEFNSMLRDIEGLGMAINPGALTGLTVWDIQKKKHAATLTRLKEMKSGQTKDYFQMMNGLSLLLGKKEEPTKAEKEKLAASIGNYVLREIAPANPNPDREAVQTAMYGMKNLVSERQFRQFVEHMNEQPGRTGRWKAEDFDRLPDKKATEKNLQKEEEAPVLKKREEWEQ